LKINSTNTLLLGMQVFQCFEKLWSKKRWQNSNIYANDSGDRHCNAGLCTNWSSPFYCGNFCVNRSNSK